MPTVPRSESQVRSHAFPGQRVNAEAPIEAFGGGPALDRTGKAFERGVESVQGLVRERMKIEEEERKKANDLKLTELDLKAQLEETRLLRDPGTGAYSQKGKNAVGIVDKYGKQYQDFLDGLEKELSNDEQKVAWAKIKARRFGAVNETLTTIEAREYETYGKGLFETSLQVHEDAAIANRDNPALVRRSIEEIKRFAEGMEKQYGAPDGWKEQEIQRRTTSIHESIIKQYLNDNKYPFAKAHFDAVQHEIDPKKHDEIKAALKNAGMHVEAGKLSEEIYFKSGGDEKAALDEARALETSNPDVAERTRTLLKRRFEDEKEAEKREKDANFEAVKKLVNDAPAGVRDLRAVIGGRIDSLSVQEQKALQSLLDGRKTNPAIMNKFRELSQNLAKLGGMSAREMETQFFQHMNPEDAKRAETRWLKARDAKANPKKAAEYKSLLTPEKTVLDALRVSGQLSEADTLTTVSKDATKAARMNEFLREVDELREAYFSEHGKNMPDAELKKSVNEMIRKKVWTDRSWFSGTPQGEVPKAATTPKERERAFIPIENLPPKFKTRMVNHIRSALSIGPDTSDAVILTRFRQRIERAAGMVRLGTPETEVLQYLVEEEMKKQKGAAPRAEGSWGIR